MKEHNDPTRRCDGESQSEPSAYCEATRRNREIELIRGCIDRNPDCFQRLAIEYEKWIHSGAQQALRETSARVSCDAEDIIQVFFMKLWENPTVLKKFDLYRPLGPWLSGIAHHWGLKYLVSREVDWSVRVVPEITAERVPSTEPSTDVIDTAPIVSKILTELSSTTEDIVQARFGVGKYSTAESVAAIAKRKGMTKSQVYHCLDRVRRVRKSLPREVLQEIDEFLKNYP